MLLVQAIFLLATYYQLAESLKLAETVATLGRSFSALRAVPTLSVRVLFWDVGQIGTGKLLKKVVSTRRTRRKRRERAGRSEKEWYENRKEKR